MNKPLESMSAGTVLLRRKLPGRVVSTVRPTADSMLRVSVKRALPKTVLVYACCPRVINRATITIEILVV